MIAYLCVIAAELEFEDIHGLRRNYRVGQVLSRLDRQNRLLFPRRARLTEKEVLGGKTLWNLDIEEVKNEDVRWLKGIHDRSGNVMHEFSPFRDFPDPQTAPYTLASDLNGIRADHQWLWNRFWQHANVLKEKLFFINLGDPSITSRPTIVKMEGFLDKEPSVDFDPNYVSDFSGEIDWAEFSS